MLKQAEVDRQNHIDFMARLERKEAAIIAKVTRLLPIYGLKLDRKSDNNDDYITLHIVDAEPNYEVQAFLNQLVERDLDPRINDEGEIEITIEPGWSYLCLSTPANEFFKQYIEDNPR